MARRSAARWRRGFWTRNGWCRSVCAVRCMTPKTATFAAANGIRLILIEEFHARGVEDVMAEAREIAGTGKTYVSYDIDFRRSDICSRAPGRPKSAGLTAIRRLQVCRELARVGHRRCRYGRGLASLRHVGRHGVSGCIDHVRNPLCDGGSGRVLTSMAETPGTDQSEYWRSAQQWVEEQEVLDALMQPVLDRLAGRNHFDAPVRAGIGHWVRHRRQHDCRRAKLVGARRAM